MENVPMNEEKRQAMTALKTCRGQIDGILNMIEEGRYCMDICHQLMAAQSMLKRANRLILGQHLKGCVVEAGDDPARLEEKTDEILQIFDKLLK